MMIQKQPSRGGLRKNCSENMEQIYRRKLIPKCDFNKIAKHLLLMMFDRILNTSLAFIITL